MKAKSYLFLFLLLLILVFILGVRYGQKVEQANKAINYLQKVTPQASPSPSPLEFKNYTNRFCGVSFLYPSSLSIKSESTSSALLIEEKAGQIQIDCSVDGQLSRILADKAVATAEITFQNKKIQAKATNQGEVFVFKIFNLLNGRSISVAVQKNLYPLLESSLQFVSP